MILKVPQWHSSLLTDYERLAIFKLAIEKYAKGIVYDLGTGSGILAMIAAKKAEKVYALELDSFTYEYAKENIERNGFKNILLYEADAEFFDYKEKADLIIAELLDTALITEPQVRVLNTVNKKKVLKEDGKIIPEKVISTVQLVDSSLSYIHYDEEDKEKELSNEIIYEEVNFYKVNPLKVSYKFKLSGEYGENLGLKLRTYTILSEEFISGPLRMLNPPLVIPLNVDGSDVKVKLSYKRGGDLDSIKVKVF
ncbi:50S ribosomal protein L11 methyltransferase [Methanocaldococcus infernus]